MMDLSFDPGQAYDWLKLLWLILGVPTFFILKKVYLFIKEFLVIHRKITMVVLGDPENGLKGVRDMIDSRAEALDGFNDLLSRADNNYTTMTGSVSAIGLEVKAMREENAVHTANIRALEKDNEGHDRILQGVNENNIEIRKALQEQSERITYIQKELTHNGGTSVKDMSRDAASNSKVLIGLFQARDNMTDSAAHFYTDDNGSFTWASRTYLYWTGFSLEEVLGAGWVNCIYPEDREAVRIAWQSAVSDGRDFEMTYRVWNREREVTWVQGKAQRIGREEDVSHTVGWYGRVIKISADQAALPKY